MAHSVNLLINSLFEEMPATKQSRGVRVEFYTRKRGNKKYVYCRLRAGSGKNRKDVQYVGSIEKAEKLYPRRTADYLARTKHRAGTASRKPIPVPESWDDSSVSVEH